MSSEDKHSLRRMQINAQAKLQTLEPFAGNHYQATCVDLSETGLSLHLNELLELGTLVKVNIDPASDIIAPLETTAKVIRASKESDGTVTAELEIIQFN